MLFQEVLMIVMPFYMGDAFDILKGILTMSFPDYREHFRMHGRVRHQNPCFFRVIIRIAYGKYAVDLSLS